jgi:hypothetical protein
MMTDTGRPASERMAMARTSTWVRALKFALHVPKKIFFVYTPASIAAIFPPAIRSGLLLG